MREGEFMVFSKWMSFFKINIVISFSLGIFGSVNGFSELSLFLASTDIASMTKRAIPMYYWQDHIYNFGDYISLKLVERIVGKPVEVVHPAHLYRRKLLAIGSILTYARDNDIVWGSGINGKCLDVKLYKFTTLDVRAVRGPLSRDFLQKNFNITVPEIYGDPALLFPYFFPELKKKAKPTHKYLIIPHYSELYLFPKEKYGETVVSPTLPWHEVIEQILDSEFVISSSLHGVIIAEAFGIPARCLKLTNKEPLFKYSDYYLGTGRPHFTVAHSVEEALNMGPEQPFKCDLKKLYDAFPFDFWAEINFTAPHLP